MKLRNPHSEQDIVAAQIVGMNGKTVTVKTETGQILRLPLTAKHQHDQIFLASLKDIWHAQIWIPVNRQLKNCSIMTGCSIQLQSKHKSD